MFKPSEQELIRAEKWGYDPNSVTASLLNFHYGKYQSSDVDKHFKVYTLDDADSRYLCPGDIVQFGMYEGKKLFWEYKDRRYFICTEQLAYGPYSLDRRNNIWESEIYQRLNNMNRPDRIDLNILQDPRVKYVTIPKMGELENRLYYYDSFWTSTAYSEDSGMAWFCEPKDIFHKTEHYYPLDASHVRGIIPAFELKSLSER